MKFFFSTSFVHSVNRGGDKTVIVWNPSSGQLMHRLEGHTSYVTCAAFSEDNKFIASGSNDKTIIIWNLKKIGENQNVSVSIAGFASHSETNKQKEQAIDLILRDSCKNDKQVSEWTVQDVIDWLNGLQLGTYASNFKTHRIDGTELLHLTMNDLLVNLKIGLFSIINLSTMNNVSVYCSSSWPSKQNTPSNHDLEKSTLAIVSAG